MSQVNLKDCPFCGQKPQLKEAKTMAGTIREFAVCGCDVMNYKYIPYEYWNTRPKSLSVEEIHYLILDLSTLILHYHDKEGGVITEEKVIHMGRFKELAQHLKNSMEGKK